jgi:hypothetical protein
MVSSCTWQRCLFCWPSLSYDGVHLYQLVVGQRQVQAGVCV